MTFWLIHPRDPLIFRDGRPFTADLGARATTLPFPYPSTLAGAARTLSVPEPRPRDFPETLVQDLLAESLRGPLLVALEKNNVKECYVPAPADALMLTQKDEPEHALRQWLRPINQPDGSKTHAICKSTSNQPDEVATNNRKILAILRRWLWRSDDAETKQCAPENQLMLVGTPKPRPEKVHPKAPTFWCWKEFEFWLKAPVQETDIKDVAEWGLRGLPQEYRTHVRINPETQTADQGGLFVTSGLEFAHAPKKDDLPLLKETTEFALVVDTSANIAAGWDSLGGERRMVRWQSLPQSPFPDCPPEVEQSILAHKSCRLILLTPAYFEGGYLPSLLLNEHMFEIVAAAVPRYQTVSGWDYKEREPKATRRLAPAGSVYYIQNIQDPVAFIKAVWMQNISDGKQNRNDGFGLAALGTWDSNDIPKMEAPRE